MSLFFGSFICTQRIRRGSVEMEPMLIMNNTSPTIIMSQSIMTVETDMGPNDIHK
jgi:hypothetical protein